LASRSDLTALRKALHPRLRSELTPEPIDWGETEAFTKSGSVTADEIPGFEVHFRFNFMDIHLAAIIRSGIPLIRLASISIPQ